MSRSWCYRSNLPCFLRREDDSRLSHLVRLLLDLNSILERHLRKLSDLLEICARSKILRVLFDSLLNESVLK